MSDAKEPVFGVITNNFDAWLKSRGALASNINIGVLRTIVPSGGYMTLPLVTLSDGTRLAARSRAVTSIGDLIEAIATIDEEWYFYSICSYSYLLSGDDLFGKGKGLKIRYATRSDVYAEK